MLRDVDQKGAETLHRTCVEVPVAFDTETFLIRPGCLAPPLVCLSSAIPVTGARIFKDDARQHFEWILKQDQIYGCNVAFDMCVCAAAWPDLLAEIFEVYDKGKVADIALSQRILDNVTGEMEIRGSYSLASLAQRFLGKDRSAQKKEPDAWRLRYSELEHVPLEQWPKAAVNYALEDAQDTLDIATLQWMKSRHYLKNTPAQARAAFALQLMMCWGVHTDPERIEQLRAVSRGMYDQLSVGLKAEGLVRADNTRNIREAQKRMLNVCLDDELEIPLTPSGRKKFAGFQKIMPGAKPEDVFSLEALTKYTAVDEKACDESGDELLKAYSRRTQLHNILNTHIPDLLKGVDAPIQPSYQTFVASGRTSCAKSRAEGKKPSPTNGFQFQNPKRALAYFPRGVGIRECFIARPGTLFADDDFSGLELCTGAQACMDVVGYSRLGDLLNAGKDPHLQFGATLMGISYEEAQARKHEKEVKTFRQRAKIPMFALPGGLGIPGLMRFARGYGVKLTVEETKQLRDDWFEEFPEWPEYFKFIRGHIKPLGENQIEQLRVDRIRGGVTFTSASNTLFQGLGADGAKAALYEVSKLCYTDGNVLSGARPVGFIHDEILAEVFEEFAHEQATEMARVMVEACNVYLPDVPVKCEPTLCKRWSKDAEAVYDGSGRLQPWDLAREGKWKVFYPDGQLVEWK